jgi:membrane-anchored protein YejM (alkaline phosphatase superfamily)
VSTRDRLIAILAVPTAIVAVIYAIATLTTDEHFNAFTLLIPIPAAAAFAWWRGASTRETVLIAIAAAAITALLLVVLAALLLAICAHEGDCFV